MPYWHPPLAKARRFLRRLVMFYQLTSVGFCCWPHYRMVHFTDAAGMSYPDLSVICSADRAICQYVWWKELDSNQQCLPFGTDLQSAATPPSLPSFRVWCWKSESNWQPIAYKTIALPIELFQHFNIVLVRELGLEPKTSCIQSRPSTNWHYTMI